MNLGKGKQPNPAQASGMSMMELLVAVSLGAIVLTVVWLLSIFAFRSFAALGNYAELDGSSRLALDLMSRQVRQATHVISVQPNLPIRSFTVANLLPLELGGPTVTNKYTWNSDTGVMLWERWEGSDYLLRTNLTGCDLWSFKMYTRAPTTNGFDLTTDPTVCKLINLNWKCSRTILGKKVNTETVLTAQLMLRNKRSN
jgi:hypothetical protein